VSGPDSERRDLGANLAMALQVGEVNLRVLELLDRGHRRQFGIPDPYIVNATPIPGKVRLAVALCKL